ncbi:MAG: MFS transporter [Alphaproteobacteria bacterium]|nr:MFS transporter [Alphaproteobacteria bacterium]
MKSPQFFFGWLVLLAIGYSLFVGAGMIFYAMSVLLETIVAATGFSVAQISGANTLFLVAAGFAGIGVGELISRYDVRYCVVIGTLVIAGAYGLLPDVSTLSEIYGVYVLLGIGYSMTALVPATTLVARWFVRRRALGLALTQSGLSLGGVLLTPALAQMLKTGGIEMLHSGWVFWVILANVPLAMAFMRPSPQAMGLLPDGDVQDGQEDTTMTQGLSAGEAVRTRFFRWSASASILALMAQVGTIAHVFKWGLERADAETAAITIASVAFCSLIGRLICGAILDRLNLYKFVLTVYLLQAATLFAMSMAQGELAVLAMTMLFGFTVGNILMVQPLLVAAAFGLRDFPRILSYQQLIMNFGVAMGPIAIGLIYDFGGGYGNAFVFVSFCSVAAFAALWMARSPDLVHG